MIEYIKNDKNVCSSSQTDQRQANAYGEFSEEEEVYDDEFIAPLAKVPQQK